MRLSLTWLLPSLLLGLAAPAQADRLFRDTQEGTNPDTAGDYAVYGNWCGPNHPKTMDPPPEALDLVDQACRRHDYCYAERGYFNCDCDMDLVDELKANLDNGSYSPGPEERYARSIYRYFSESPCTGDDSRKPESARNKNRMLEQAAEGVKGFLRNLLNGEQQTPEQK